MNGYYPTHGTSQAQQGHLEKPPIGLVPRKIHTESRMRDIFEAMKLYSDAKRPIPVEWLTEYNELASSLY